MIPIANYRILQYNVLHQKQGWTCMKHLFEMPFAKRAQNVAKAILVCAPDVVFPAERHEEWVGIDAGAMDGAVMLTNLLGDRYSTAEDFITYEGETAANRTPILYDNRKFKCVESGFIKLTEEAAFSASCNKRVVTWALLEDVTDSEARGTCIAVFNTHWSFSEYKGTSYAEIRNAQTKEMQALVNSERFRGIPKVIGGDFNAVYSEPIYSDLLQV